MITGALISGTTTPPLAFLNADELLRVLLLRDHATRVVVIGTMLLGLAAGIIGTFMLLRRRALVGDALSHATLPGICVAFIVMVLLGGEGRFLPGLLLGATASGLLGVGAIAIIRGTTRVKEDAALGIVLSTSFGLGVALLGVIQKMPVAGQAGLTSFIYGKTASMLERDALLVGVSAVVVAGIVAALFKELTLLSFDAPFAAAQGRPVAALDLLMMVLVTGVTVIGLQAVGLILIISLLIIPPAAARFWTDHMRATLVVAGLLGAASGMVGAALSAIVPDLPAGAIIVVVAAAFFVVSMLLGSRRGVLLRVLGHRRRRRAMTRVHLLRALYELEEAHASAAGVNSVGAPIGDLLRMRSWTNAALSRSLARARRDGVVEVLEAAGTAEVAQRTVRLTAAGWRAAARVVRNHRLWEIFLITHAEIAPSHVDRDADMIEHVLGPDLIQALEAALVARAAPSVVPASPHVLAPEGSGGGTTP